MEDFISEIILNSEEISKECQRIGQEISRDYQGKIPLLIGLLKGCIPFMAEVMKNIKTDVQIDFMSVSSYRGTTSTGAVSILRDTTMAVKDRHVILVEDIVDTGLTIQEVVHLLYDRGAASIEIATLLDKPEGRIVNCLKPKYIGHTVGLKFVVGFGLDYNQLYRNLNYIGVLKESVYKK